MPLLVKHDIPASKIRDSNKNAGSKTLDQEGNGSNRRKTQVLQNRRGLSTTISENKQRLEGCKGRYFVFLEGIYRFGDFLRNHLDYEPTRWLIGRSI
jgi:hypothetical protein